MKWGKNGGFTLVLWRNLHHDSLITQLKNQLNKENEEIASVYADILNSVLDHGKKLESSRYKFFRENLSRSFSSEISVKQAGIFLSTTEQISLLHYFMKQCVSQKNNKRLLDFLMLQTNLIDNQWCYFVPPPNSSIPKMPPHPGVLKLENIIFPLLFSKKAELWEEIKNKNDLAILELMLQENNFLGRFFRYKVKDIEKDPILRAATEAKETTDKQSSPEPIQGEPEHLKVINDFFTLPSSSRETKETTDQQSYSMPTEREPEHLKVIQEFFASSDSTIQKEISTANSTTSLYPDLSANQEHILPNPEKKNETVLGQSFSGSFKQPVHTSNFALYFKLFTESSNQSFATVPDELQSQYCNLIDNSLLENGLPADPKKDLIDFENEVGSSNLSTTAPRLG